MQKLPRGKFCKEFCGKLRQQFAAKKTFKSQASQQHKLNITGVQRASGPLPGVRGQSPLFRVLIKKRQEIQCYF